MAQMDASLAKGLCNRFFKSVPVWENEADTAESPFSAEKKVPSLTRWAAVMKEFMRLHFEPVSFCYSDHGRGANFKIKLVQIRISDERPFNSWQERCVFGSTLLLKAKNAKSEVLRSPFYIGEHAIRRVIQRSGIFDHDSPPLDLKKILREFSYLPMFSAFWTFFALFRLREGVDLENLNILVPSPNGALLGYLLRDEKKTHFVEIRTFVDTGKLGPDQLLLRNHMIGFTDNPSNCVLSYFGISSENLGEYKACIQLLSHMNPTNMKLAESLTDPLDLE